MPITRATNLAGLGTVFDGTGLNVSGVSTFSGITTYTAPLFGTQASFTGFSTFSTEVDFLNGPVQIGTATSTGTASQRLQVTGGAYVSGNVGIATTNPSTTLQVNSGSSAVVVSAGGSIGIGTTNPRVKLHVQSGIVSAAPRGGTNTRILFECNSTGSNYWEFQANASSFNDILFSKSSVVGSSYGIVGYDHASDALRFHVNSEERVRITSNGNVGVGTDNPATRLHVAGGNIKVDSGYGIDFSATANSSGTMISEVLDDYERGTWTPTFTAGTGTVGRSSYIKVGRLVTCSLSFSFTSPTVSAFTFTLPFTSDTSTSGGSNTGVESHGSVMMNAINTTPTNGLFATVYIWNSSGFIYWTLSGGLGWVQSAGTNIGSSTQITFSYFAAS